jgi:hypothetical protein
MPFLYEVTDPFHPTKNLVTKRVEVGFHTNEYETTKGVSYHVYVNNKPCPQGAKLHEGDTALFIPNIHGNVVIGLIIAIIIAAAIYFFLDTNIPNINGLPEADPVYTLKGQQNQIKQGEPVEKHYGQVRHWPSYASRPYNQFIGDDQWLYALLCIGAGEYIVDEILIDDTPLSNFENAEYQICKPGQKVTLFPTHVQTSSEIGGIELLGTNEEDHDWSGPFNIVNADNTAYRLELDLSFRQGLYKTDKGNLSNQTVTALFEYRQISKTGSPIGDWQTLTEFTQTLATVDSKRFTVAVDVPTGRYQVRGKRTNAKPSDFKIRDTLTWESARAFISTEQNFGNVTLLALKLQASNNLNDNSRNNFNVRIRSKAYKYNGTSWVIGETRNPIWAFCDILLSDYGRNLSPKFLDLEAIVEIANDIEDEGIYFDATFDSRSTVWQALTECLMASRCRPNLPGTLISIVRDVAMSMPTICLNPHNIIPDSFKVSHGFPRVNDKDGLEVEYINPTTWKRESVLCLIGNDRGINPEKVILKGCTNRNRAYRWGRWHRANTVYKKTNVSLTTGLEGATVSFGDLAAVQHDLLPGDHNKLPEHTGKIIPPVYWDGTFTVIELPFEPEFESGQVHRIALSDTQGNMRGPYVCTKGFGNRVVISGNLDLTLFNTNENEEVPSYFFGVTGKEVSFFKVIGITPGSNYGEVNLTLSPYDERVYSYVNDEAPPLENDFVIPETPSFPTVTNLLVSPIPDNLTRVNVSWSAAIGAIDYIVELSLDGVNYRRVARTTLTSVRIDITPGEIWVRVAAVGLKRGPWVIWQGIVGEPQTVPFPPEKPTVNDFDVALYVSTEKENLATSYKWNVRILNNALTDLVLISTITTTNPSLTYKASTAKTDATAASVTLKRDLTVSVIAVNSFGDSEESEELEVTNDLPVAVTGLSASVIQNLGSTKRCLFSWDSLEDNDIQFYRLYISTTNGFTPGSSNQVFSSNADAAEITLNTGTLYYYRVGVKDRWGDEIVMSSQASFTP